MQTLSGETRESPALRDPGGRAGPVSSLRALPSLGSPMKALSKSRHGGVFAVTFPCHPRSLNFTELGEMAQLDLRAFDPDEAFQLLEILATQVRRPLSNIG
jgi:hypothetical protein